ncbi:unnamed protein product [Amoebophrya sp. A25]|nr:unnamed protein product [Amoebophrya sp. A25]|eukprot:GSA25T00022296001.1
MASPTKNLPAAPIIQRMQFSHAPKTKAVQRALAEHLVETKQLDYAEKHNVSMMNLKTGGSRGGPSSASVSWMSDQRGFHQNSTDDWNANESWSPSKTSQQMSQTFHGGFSFGGSTSSTGPRRGDGPGGPGGDSRSSFPSMSMPFHRKDLHAGNYDKDGRFLSQTPVDQYGRILVKNPRQQEHNKETRIPERALRAAAVTATAFYPPVLRKFHEGLPVISDPDPDPPTTLRKLVKTYHRGSGSGGLTSGSKTKSGKGRRGGHSGSAQQLHKGAQEEESTALISKEERLRRETVKRLKTDLSMMRNHLSNLKTQSRQGHKYLQDMVKEYDNPMSERRYEAGDLRIFHSVTSRKWIRPSERLYNEPRMATLEPLELRETLKEKAGAGREHTHATPYRGYETIKDVRGLSKKMKTASVRVVPAGETFLTNAIRSTYFHGANVDGPASLKSFHPSMQVKQQPVAVYDYLNRGNNNHVENPGNKADDEDSGFGDVDDEEYPSREMDLGEQEDGQLTPGRPPKKGEKRWFAGTDGKSPEHARGPKRSPTTREAVKKNRHKQGASSSDAFSRYKTHKKKAVIQNPDVPRGPHDA